MPMYFYTNIRWQDIATRKSRTVNWFTYRTYSIDLWNGYKFSDVSGTWQGGNLPSSINWPYKQLDAKWDYYDVPDPSSPIIYEYTDYQTRLDFVRDTIQLLGKDNNGFEVSIDDFVIKYASGVNSATSDRIAAQTHTIIDNTSEVSVRIHDVNAESRDLNDDSVTLSSDNKRLAEASMVKNIGIDVESWNGYWNDQKQTYWASTNVGRFGDVGIIGNDILSIPLEIRPGINYFRPKTTVNYCYGMEIRTDSKFGWPGDSYGPKVTYAGEQQTITYNDVRAIDVQNHILRQTYEVRIEVISKMELSGEITPLMMLEDPYIASGDLIWNMMITGDTGATITYLASTSLGDLFGDIKTVSNELLNLLEDWLPYIIAVLVFVVGIYVVIQFQPMIKAAVAAKSKMM